MNRLKLITALTLLLICTYAKGQDKIITTQNDTILCRIVSISQTYIQYEQDDGNRSMVGRFIPVEQVQEYFYNSKSQKSSRFFSKRKETTEPFSRWRIGIQGGGAYLTAPSDDSMQGIGMSQSQAKDYEKQLRNGLIVSADIHYFIQHDFGIGLKYSLFTSSTQMDFLINTTTYPIPVFNSMGIEEKIYVNYIAPSVVFQQWLTKNRKFKMSVELSLGYASYRDEVRFDPYQYVLIIPETNEYIYNMLAEGNTVGTNLQISFDYYILPRLSVGANAGFFMANFSSLKVSYKDTSYKQELSKGNYLNMSHLEYSIGLRFHF